jgi:hypothetical protein
MRPIFGAKKYQKLKQTTSRYISAHLVPFPNKKKPVQTDVPHVRLRQHIQRAPARAAVTLPPPLQQLLRRFTPRARLAIATPDVYAPSTDASTSLRRENKKTKNRFKPRISKAPPPFARCPQALHRFPHAVRAGVEHGKGALVHRGDALAGQRRHNCFVPQHRVHVARCVPAHPYDLAP